MAALTQMDASAISEGARLAGLLPYLEEYIDKQEHVLDTKIFQLLDKNLLTPDIAIYAWQEKLVLRRLLKNFDLKVRIGTSTAERNADALKWEDRNGPTT